MNLPQEDQNEKRQIPLVNLSRQHEPIQPQLEAVFREILATSSFIGGHWLERFEEEFARYCNSRHAVGVSSGSAALELSLRACGIGPGDEVLVPVFTFIATAASVTAVGARPVFVDVDPEFYTLDPLNADQKITPRSKAIIPVHLYGQMADMERIAELASRRNLILIEDAAQAHGARLHGKSAGSWGLAAAYSFYPSKNLGACGDAGAVATDDDSVAKRIRLLRNHGSLHDKYRHEIPAFNHRMDTLQAAILTVKLKYLGQWNEWRREAAGQYRRALPALDLILPQEQPGSTHVYHLFVIRTRQRDALQKFLRGRGIDTGLHYPIPLHLQPAYRHLGYQEGDFPAAEQLAREVLSLPLFPGITPAEVHEVAECVRAFFCG
ncbi:MAG: hypothetical protein A3H27_03220 [Acidobacteria bacterium RIFCSPLOWO2_02_FULL_59_13]|nr:MAG: hypothetical protein A3H27_03220 [Acidobacteria bacterium RIFCSPLOWO2_02_FULL_59_13]OFW32085.1 MAG: hypothetical protein A3J28_08450 [Acidobacteria bacterium RIFCSPLOWO2_12_FULL_60_22]